MPCVYEWVLPKMLSNGVIWARWLGALDIGAFQWAALRASFWDGSGDNAYRDQSTALGPINDVTKSNYFCSRGTAPASQNVTPSGHR